MSAFTVVLVDRSPVFNGFQWAIRSAHNARPWRASVGAEHLRSRTTYYTPLGLSVSIPRKHHYVPEFYLKQWAGADKRLCEHKRMESRTETRRTFPAGTGYEQDLYRVAGLPEELAQAVESKFMNTVDTEAKYALDKLASGDTTPWDPGMRSAWTRFILSLLFRNPETVEIIKRHMEDIWKDAVDPATFDDVADSSEQAALRLLQEIIDNDHLGPVVFDMHWSHVSLAASSLPLLTSDRPLCIPCGLGEPPCWRGG